MSFSADHYARLIRIGHELLAADRDVANVRRDCIRHKLPDDFTAKAAESRRRLLCQPIRDRLAADSLDLDDLAILRCMQEIAFVRDEATSADHWSELPGHFDDVVSGVDAAIAAEAVAQAEAA